MSIERYEADLTTAKERVSLVKVRSAISLVFGQRASHFDAFLKSVPTSAGMTALAKQLDDKPEIYNAIFDLDGTLVAPYAPISEEVIKLLLSYKDDGRNIAIYTNSPHTDRLDILRDNGIVIANTGVGKPAVSGFDRLCKAEDMDPRHTAMIGNFPITDMPYVEEGDNPFFPLNVLVESIPPHRQLVTSQKKYIRAKIFDAINRASVRVVLHRNPDIPREINSLPHAA